VYAVLRAFHPWNTRCNEAIVLKEIQMTPGYFLKIVGLTQRAACRAGIFCSTLRTKLKAQFKRLFLHIEILAQQFPRCAQPKPKRENIFCLHPCSSGFSYSTGGKIKYQIPH
jgi:hypothetical protein